MFSLESPHRGDSYVYTQHTIIVKEIRKNDVLFATNGDPDQPLPSAESDLGLHCLPITLLRVSRLQLPNH